MKRLKARTLRKIASWMFSGYCCGNEFYRMTCARDARSRSRGQDEARMCLDIRMWFKGHGRRAKSKLILS